MSILQEELPAARVLDLFAGSGALGIEALSRGASEAVFVELAPRSIQVLRANLAALGAGGEARIHRGDAFRYLSRRTWDGFDIAFADPPYGLGLAERVARRWLEEPFARVLGIEHEKKIELPEGTDRRVYGDTVVTFYRTP